MAEITKEFISNLTEIEQSKTKPTKKAKRQAVAYNNNVNFQLTRARILTKVLTQEDKKLVANLIDQSGLVILHPEDLQELIAAMKGVELDAVQISTRETIITQCCKARILPFKSITAIAINGTKLPLTDRQILTSIYHISLETVYDEPFKKLNKDGEPADTAEEDALDDAADTAEEEAAEV